MKGWAESARRYAIERGEPLINCGLIVLLAYLSANLTWAWLTPADPSASGTAAFADGSATFADGSVPAQPPSTLGAPANASELAERIAQWHLFGRLEASKPLPVTVLKAPETTLDLRLAGIFHSSSASKPPLALIAAGTGLEQRYHEGDLLAKDITVERIQRDKVLLLRRGKLETLTLPRESSSQPPAAGSATSSGERLAVAQPAARQAMTVQAGRIAQQLRGMTKSAQPDSLQDIAYADPHVQDGRFVGLRLKPGRNRQLLGQLGLRTGDVLTELNGNRLTDPAQGASLLQQLLTADQIDAKVIRNGVEMPFTFVLNQ